MPRSTRTGGRSYALARQRADGLLVHGQSYYTCQARNSTVCDPALTEMHAKALPLKGAERQKAYEDIAKYVHDQFYTVPIGHPNYYYGLSNEGGLEAAPGRLHHGQGDEAEVAHPPPGRTQRTPSLCRGNGPLDRSLPYAGEEMGTGFS